MSDEDAKRLYDAAVVGGVADQERLALLSLAIDHWTWREVVNELKALRMDVDCLKNKEDGK
jgi:hypothetical protein